MIMPRGCRFKSTSQEPQPQRFNTPDHGTCQHWFLPWYCKHECWFIEVMSQDQCVCFFGELGQTFTLLWGGATTTTAVFNSNLPNTSSAWGLGCQVASSHNRIFSRFLLLRAVFSASLLLFWQFSQIFLSKNYLFDILQISHLYHMLTSIMMLKNI
jgi:hypothetical protein